MGNWKGVSYFVNVFENTCCYSNRETYIFKSVLSLLHLIVSIENVSITDFCKLAFLLKWNSNIMQMQNCKCKSRTNVQFSRKSLLSVSKVTSAFLHTAASCSQQLFAHSSFFVSFLSCFQWPTTDNIQLSVQLIRLFWAQWDLIHWFCPNWLTTVAFCSGVAGCPPTHDECRRRLCIICFCKTKEMRSVTPQLLTRIQQYCRQ